MRKFATLSTLALGISLSACASMDKPRETIVMSDMCEAQAMAVFFETGSANLDNDAEATLNSVAKAYDDCDLFKIEVVGYADSVGNSASNLSLSEDRAEMVLAELNDRGVTADRVSIVPMGERTILDDEEPDAFERRAVMTLLPTMK
ncbi:MAG: OmpA family protein [Litorimonas sp.]